MKISSISLLAILALNSALYSQQSIVTLSASAPQSGGDINWVGTGIQYHQLTCTVQGTVTGCTVALDSSTNGSTYTAGGIITGQTCTSNFSSSIVNQVSSHGRITFTTLTGGGTVTCVYDGWVANPSQGGISNGQGISAALFCPAASGSGTAYTCTTTPSFTPIDGTILTFDVDVASGSSPTLAVNGAAAAPLKKYVTGASSPTSLIANDLQPNQPFTVYFDAGLGQWTLQSPTANSSTGPTGTPTSTDILTSNGVSGGVQDPGACTMTSSVMACNTANYTIQMSGGGTSTTPNIDFASIALYKNALRDLRITMSGADAFQFTNGPFTLGSAGTIRFGSSGIASPDTGISRDAAGVVDIGNGTQGNKTGTLNVAILNPSSGIVGTNTNNSAPAGDVGEIISAQVVKGSAVSLSTGTAANVTSVSLAAGDWDCSGAIDFTFGATTSVTNIAGSFSQTSATMGGQDSGFDSAVAAMVPTSANDSTFPMPVFQELLSGTTTVFLVAKAAFTISTTSAYGTIRCRRVR